MGEKRPAKVLSAHPPSPPRQPLTPAEPPLPHSRGRPRPGPASPRSQAPARRAGGGAHRPCCRSACSPRSPAAPPPPPPPLRRAWVPVSVTGQLPVPPGAPRPAPMATPLLPQGRRRGGGVRMATATDGRAPRPIGGRQWNGRVGLVGKGRLRRGGGGSR